MLKIRELRKAAKISQKTLAEECGVKQPTVVAWEKNKSQPKADKLPVIAKALGCEIADLYEEGTV
jgi:transcriptional regulator with XRE-family HTH domain